MTIIEELKRAQDEKPVAQPVNLKSELPLTDKIGTVRTVTGENRDYIRVAYDLRVNSSWALATEI